MTFDLQSGSCQNDDIGKLYVFDPITYSYDFTRLAAIKLSTWHSIKFFVTATLYIFINTLELS